jgi:hypothetical protein
MNLILEFDRDAEGRWTAEVPELLPGVLVYGKTQGQAARKALAMAGELLEDDPTALVIAAAPIDDEPLTPEDEAAIAEGHAATERGECITTEELNRRLGLDDAVSEAW